jgi:hypothetical protein
VEVREQDAKGSVHRVAKSGSGLTEAGREAQAQMARRRLMSRSPQVLVLLPRCSASLALSRDVQQWPGCRMYSRNNMSAPLLSLLGHSQCESTLEVE